MRRIPRLRSLFFFFNDTATPEIYPLPLHDALPILMAAADIARKNGPTTIAITASGSPLASACHIHLAADHPEGYDRYSPMVSRLLHLLVIDVLATCVALRIRSEEHTSELQSQSNLVCRLLLEKKKKNKQN